MVLTLGACDSAAESESVEPEDGVSGKADGAEHSLDVAPEVEIRVANGAEVLGTVVYRTPVRELDEELVEEECVPVENDLKLDAEIEAAAEAIAREETRQMCVFMAEQHLKLLQACQAFPSRSCPAATKQAES